MIAIEQDRPFVQFIMLYVVLTFVSVDRKTEDVTIFMKTIEHHCPGVQFIMRHVVLSLDEIHEMNAIEKFFRRYCSNY